MAVDLIFLLWAFSRVWSDIVWCYNAFISLPIQHPCLMMGEWRYRWGAIKVFWFFQCWSCASTSSVMGYGPLPMANHFLCTCVVWLCLWYGPKVCNKELLSYYVFQLQIQSKNCISKSYANPKTKSCLNPKFLSLLLSYYARPICNPKQCFKEK